MDLIATAYHEAGHVVVGWIAGRRAKSVGVYPDGLDDLDGEWETIGRATFLPRYGRPRRDEVSIKIAIAFELAISLAGPVAERRILCPSRPGKLTPAMLSVELEEYKSKSYSTNRNNPSDVSFVLHTILAKTHDWQSLGKIYRVLERNLNRFVAQPAIWSRIKTVADHLIERQSLEGFQIDSLLKPFETRGDILLNYRLYKLTDLTPLIHGHTQLRLRRIASSNGVRADE